jgi:MoaA/NifB/PqqE/SkfB family radical SAM enzyme
MTAPYCTAPFHGALIETDKTVRPCCIWAGEAIGDLKTQTLNDILNSDKLKHIQASMLNGSPPSNCHQCVTREKIAGRGVRQNIYGMVPYLGNTKLTYLEFNSSNLCNLVCAGCGPSWSSAWASFIEDNSEWQEIRKSDHNRAQWKLHPPQPDFANNFFKNTDFSELAVVMIKGGEPFLNKENILLLEHLDNIGLLSKIEVIVTTNGTYTSDIFLTLLSKAKSVKFWMSIDGVGKLNQYIRFDPKHPDRSHTNNIKQNIIEYASLDNIVISSACTIQAHNVFKLDELQQFWENEIKPISTKKILPVQKCGHILIYPDDLSLHVFSENTRNMLADKYESMNDKLWYDTVISVLRQKVPNNIFLHNKFVKYTEAIDRTRPYKFIDLVPEAKDEFIYK